MSDELSMLSGRVPSELKDLVDADSRDNQEVIRAALWREFGGERKSDLERQLHEKKKRETVVENEMTNRQEELSDLREEINALEKRLNKQKSEEEAKLKQALDTLENVPWEPDNPAIQSNAEELGIEPEQLIEELEEYYAE